MMKRLTISKNLIIEILRSGQSASYRWFRFRELVGFPSYAKEDKRKRLLVIRLLILGGTIS